MVTGSKWAPRQVGLGNVLGAAADRAAAMPIYKRSMRGAAANEVGAVGEMVAMKYLRLCGVDVEDDPEIDGDLWVAGRRVEVKTKERTVAPAQHHDCSAPDYNHDVQTPDWWLFVSLEANKGVPGVRRFWRAWICGAITDVRMRELGKLWVPGEYDSNGWTATIPVWNVPVSSLVDPAEMWCKASTGT